MDAGDRSTALRGDAADDFVVDSLGSRRGGIRLCEDG
jgi:hypothetical protein